MTSNNLRGYFVLVPSRTLARAIYAATQSPNVPAVCPWYSVVNAR